MARCITVLTAVVAFLCGGCSSSSKERTWSEYQRQLDQKPAVNELVVFLRQQKIEHSYDATTGRLQSIIRDIHCGWFTTESLEVVVTIVDGKVASYATRLIRSAP